MLNKTGGIPMSKRILVMLIAVAMLLCCCVAAQAAGDPTKVVVGVAAEPDAFFVCHSVNSTNMDECPVLHNIYDTLIRRNVDGTYTGLLATDWSISEDGLTYTFTIRDGVKFSDGRDMTLEDVVFSFDYTASTKGGKTQLVNYDHAEIVDEANRIVAIHLTSAYGGFINAVVNRYGLIYSKSYFEEVGEDGYDAAPITTGPYKFVEHVSGDHVTVTYNEYYWGEKPAITDITYKVVKDVNTQMIALEAGEIDCLLNANISPLLQLAPDSTTKYAIASTAQYTTIGFNCSPSQPTSDINLRKAICYAIDRDDVNFGAYEDMTTIATHTIPYGFNARPDDEAVDYYTYDPDKAAEYLAQSNYNGEEVKLITVSGTKDESVCKIVQAQLMDLGINCTMLATDAGSYTSMLNDSGDYAICLRSSSSSLMDSDMLIFAFNADVVTTPKYDNGWSEEFTNKMRDLTWAGRAEGNAEKRKEIYTEAIQYLYDEAMSCPIVYGLNVVAYNEKLQGVEPGPLVGIYYIYDWSWAE